MTHVSYQPQALLAYLESEAGRIMGPVGAAPAAAGLGPGQGPGPAAGQGAAAGDGGGAQAARKFAAGLFSKARELFRQGTQEQPAVAEVHRWAGVLWPSRVGLGW